MEFINMSSASKYFFAFLCIFMILSAGEINGYEPEGAALVKQGLCKSYPQGCDKHCRDRYGDLTSGHCNQQDGGNYCICVVVYK
ncbi:hypothetical protein M5689_008133 [Euphorbia peplus]|nr:hypothetical protein M5689_008133 [Euphorbia peplus]